MPSIGGLDPHGWLRHTSGSHLGAEEPTDTAESYLLAILCQRPHASVHCVSYGNHYYAAILALEKLIAVGGGGLLESLRVIRVRVAIVAPDLMAVAFKNVLLAHRGSIRQTHDAQLDSKT